MRHRPCARKNSSDSDCERTSRGDEAEDQVALGGKIEEVAGVDVDVLAVEEVDGKVLVGAGGGNAEDGVPAGFD